MRPYPVANHESGVTGGWIRLLAAYWNYNYVSNWFVSNVLSARVSAASIFVAASNMSSSSTCVYTLNVRTSDS